MKNQFLFCYITCGSVEQAKEISKKLLEERLAACTNILPGMISSYWWEGKVQQDEEVILIAKTKSELFDQLKVAVVKIHSYDCPCVIGLPFSEGHQPYLDWLASETSSPRK